MHRITFYISLLIVTVLVCIEVFRATHIGMTSDESYSFTRYVHEPYINIITYIDIIILPNNHILNTIGMKFFSSIFGISPVVLRFTNLLAFACYCVAFLLWLKENARGIYYIPITVCLFFNPYMLDFFMLARGYGLGMCLMMMSIFAVSKLLNKKDIRLNDYYWPLSLAALAVWANFAFLNFYLGFCVVIELIITYRRLEIKKLAKENFFKKHQPVIVVTCILFAAIFWPMFQIMKAHQLYGGMDGFWQNTVQSLIARSIYESIYPAWVTLIINYFILLSIGTFILYLIFKLKTESRKTLINPVVHAGFFLLLPALANILEHHLLKTEFPEDRTAVFYIPLFMFFIIRLSETIKIRFNLVLYVLCVLVTINLYSNLNFNYVWEWKYDVNTGKMMSNLKGLLSDCKSTSNAQINLGCNPLFEPTTNYYRQYLEMNCIKELDRDGLVNEVDYDYVYIMHNDPKFKKTDDWKLVKSYPVSESELLRK